MSCTQYIFEVFKFQERCLVIFPTKYIFGKSKDCRKVAEKVQKISNRVASQVTFFRTFP